MKIKQDSFFSSGLGLAFMAGIGLMVANISPTIVSAYVQNPIFSTRDAGNIISINMLGNALGALIISFYLQRFNWFRAAVFLLSILIVLDLFSISVTQSFLLFSVRFIYGMAAGALMGIAYAAIAQTSGPERIQALSYTMQLLSGGILIQLITPQIESAGVIVVWLPLVVFSVIGLLLSPLLRKKTLAKDSLVATKNQSRANNLIIGLGLASLFAFQMGQFAAFAYVIELGINHNFNIGFTGTSVAMGLWIGGPAALFVTWWSLRSGRALPIILASSAQIVSIGLLLVPNSAYFLIGNVTWGIAFNIGISYILGLISELDNEGRTATLAAFASTLGLFAGPGLAAFLVGENNYERVILASLAILLISVALIIIPAMKLDSSSKTRRIIWS